MGFRRFDGLDLPYRIYWDIFNPLTICRKDATEDGVRREGKALMIPWWSIDCLSIFQKLDFLDWSALSTHGFRPSWSLADYESTWVDSFMGLIQKWTRHSYPIFCFSTIVSMDVWILRRWPSLHFVPWMAAHQCYFYPSSLRHECVCIASFVLLPDNIYHVLACRFNTIDTSMPSPKTTILGKHTWQSITSGLTEDWSKPRRLYS